MQKIIREACTDWKFHEELEESSFDLVARALIDWTGGAPRPLLYVINILEALHQCHGQLYKTEDGLRKVFDAILTCIKKNNILSRELGVVYSDGNKHPPEEIKAYQYFCWCSYFKTLISPNDPVHSDGKQASTYLRSFNIFASPKETGKIQVVAPKIVQSIVQNMETAIENVLQFRTQSSSEVIEECVAYFIRMWHCVGDTTKLFFSLIPQEMIKSVILKSITQWERRGPVIKKEGKLTCSEIDSIVKNRDIGRNTRQLKFTDFDYFCHKLSLGDLVIFGKKSASADIIIKIGDCQVVEIQCKAGKQQLTPNEVNVEVQKSVVSYSKCFRSIFVLIVPCGATKSSITNDRIDVVIPSETFFGSKFFLEFFQKNDLLQ